MKKQLKRFLITAFILSLLVTFWVPAEAHADDSLGDRYNIMLVIDGSGSLTSQAAGYTDPNGMRYALIGELMGILEDDGHNIGAIVFSGTQSTDANPTDAVMEEGIMLNTGILSLDRPAPDGRPAKDYLEDEIRRVNVDNSRHGCTDIGTALLLAEKQLKEMNAKNGLESIVFLFTDGNTTFYGNPAGIVDKSISNRDTATLEMSESGIRLFGAFLNNGGNLDDSEMKRLVCAANGISASSGEFGYSYVEIQDASNIHAASTSFLKFLGYIDPDFVPNATTESIHDSFVIPGLGVEEMNIRLYSPHGRDLPSVTLQITKPDGSVINASPSKESRTYRVYKLVNPEPGTWQIDVNVPKGNTLSYVYTPVISLFIDSVVEISPAVQDLCVNKTADFTARLSQSGTVVSDPAAYMGYDCVLEFKDVSTGSTVSYELTANTSGVLTHSMPLDTYGTYTVRSVFSCGDIVVPSTPVTLDLANKAPVIIEEPFLKVRYGLFESKTYDIDLLDYINDPEDGAAMSFGLARSTCNADAITLSGSLVTLDSKNVDDGSITFAVADSQGAVTELNINIRTFGVTVWYVLALILLLVIAAAAFIVITRLKNANRPDGELFVSFDMPCDGRSESISLDLPVPGVQTSNKTNLNRLIQDALKEDSHQVAPGIYAQDVKSFLIPFSTPLSGITVAAALKKKGKKNVGAISVKQGKSATVLYSSSKDFCLNEVFFSVSFNAAAQDDNSGLFDGSFPFQNGASGESNPFDDFDNYFEPAKPTAKKKSKMQPDDDNDLFF